MDRLQESRGTGSRTGRSHSLIKVRGRASIRVSAILVVAGILAGATLGGAVAAFGVASGQYSRDDSDTNCNGKAIDPVTAVFAGQQAGVESVARNIITHAGWPFRGVGVGEQNLKVYRQTTSFLCKPNTEGMSSYPFGPGGYDRYHIRLWLSWYVGGKPKTVGTAHKERLVQGCSPPFPDHAVIGYGVDPNDPSESGYEMAKHALRAGFINAGHIVDNVYYGNTIAIEQCPEGWIAANGNGYAALITVNHSH